MFDQLNDTNYAVLYKVSQEIELPNFVKSASVATKEERDTLDSSSFAMPELRMFPTHTKSETWLSAVYLKEAKGIEDTKRLEIEKNIEKAAKFWGITDDDCRVRVRESSEEGDRFYYVKYASDDECTVLVSDAEELNKVAQDIIIRHDYPYETKQKVAIQILAAPSVLKKGISDQDTSLLNKIAGYGVGSANSARKAISQRKASVSNSWKHLGDGINELDSLIKQASQDNNDSLLSPGILCKVAAMLDAIDRFAGLSDKYSCSFRPAYEQVFEVSLSDADMFSKEAVQLSCGNVVSKDQLRRSEASAWIERCLGEKVASEEEMIEYIKGMPPRRASLLLKHIQDS